MLAECIAVPAIAAAGGQRAADGLPEAGGVVAEHLQGALGIVEVPVQRHGDVAGRADDHAHHAGLDQPRARGLDDGVAAAGVDRQALGQARFLSAGAGDAAGEVGRFEHIRENGLVKAGQGDEVVGPDALAGIEEARARGVGGVDGQLAADLQADVVLGADEARHLREQFRLLFLEPDEFAAGVAGQHLVVGVGEQAGEAAGLFGDPIALFLRAAVAPEDGGADDVQILIQRHQAVHLAGKADAGDLVLGHVGLGEDDLQAAHHRVPPVLGVLLRPAGLGGGERVFLRGGSQHRALVVHEDALRAGGADVQTDEVFACHAFHPFVVSSGLTLIFLKLRRFSVPLDSLRMLARWLKMAAAASRMAKMKYIQKSGLLR